MRFFVFSVLLLATVVCQAKEVAPWFGNLYEVEGRCSAACQKYERVNSGKESFSYSSADLFTNFSLGFSHDPNWDIEVEALFADTHHRNYGYDSGTITGRYLIMDDIIGDPLSLTAGLSGIFPIHSSLRDIGSFHHGMFECEGHIAIGQEQSYLSQWISRNYGVFSLGIATQGSPWVRIEYYLDKRFCNSIAIELSLKSLFGFGTRSIHKKNFNGYGAIAHRSIDAGLAISHTYDYWGVLSLEYAFRIYAKNFPRNTNWFQISYFMPIGL